MYRTSISFLTPSETGSLSSSVLNRPLTQLAGNVEYLKALVDAGGRVDNLLLGQACTSSVSVGTPVAWNATTKIFEPALAGSKSCLGVCKTKSSATICDVRLLGYDTIDLTASTGSASPTAGLYYLSQTTAGELSSTRPATGVQQPVLYADGQGGVYLLYGEYMPLIGPQGIQGIPGAEGATGETGARGATGPAALPSFKSGQWYVSPVSYSPVGVNYTFDGDRMIAVPFSAPGGTTITELAVKVLSAGNPGDEGRLGIYADANYYPGALLTAANGVFNGASGGAKAVSVNETTIAAGQLVWLVMAINSSAMGISSRDRSSAWAFKGWSDGLNDPILGYVADYAYAALPDTFPLNANSLVSVIPSIFAKVS